MTEKRSTVIFILVAQLLTPPAGAAIPSTEARPRVGILRVGEEGTSREEKAYSVLEKKVRRWVENNASLAPNVSSLPLSLQTEHVRLETDRARLDALAKQGGESEELRGLRAKLSRVSRYSPTVQRAYVTEARAAWEKGEKGRATGLLREGALLHPDGIFAEGEISRDWEEEATDPLAERLRKVASEIRRACEVRLTGADGAEAIVNGFAFGSRREFQLPAGGQFHFQVSRSGFEPWEKNVRCDRQRRSDFAVELRPAKSRVLAPSVELTKITQGQQMNSLFLIQAAAETFRVYLFTPGSSPEEIPMRKPLRVAEILDNPGESLPIARDAAQGLFERHRLAQVSWAEAPAVIAGDFGNADPRWYNDWRLWAVAGSVLTGVLVGYFATRGPEVKTQGGPAGIRLQID